ncbi:epoxide hydrolase family protein [Novosphingobium cyanobacteriorum]|uniref:Alpha/beta fold hydrolase n=1 Tax=Novosphingobium cyanobacteriorum TaxID=3024215 RepID=A0ABT6CMY9_9SPHN|nr:epoxide hydrolase family protein [Novosphingobium cyanobacteriorum]MDF8334943.1 alpha/beta fold hydrolase [Novosphingobium cyanobacteriorum]
MSPRPFRVDVPQAVLDRISMRVADARIGYAPNMGGPWDYGTDSVYLAELIDYWRDCYDWRVHERALNQWPQFMAEVDGVDIHFYHIQGDGSRPLPIILTHGWPGSVLEFQAAIPLLLKAGFTLVVPSLPGYGFSGRPKAFLGPASVAAMWRKLMVDVLGYPRFLAQGGDWGSAVTFQLGASHADVVAAIHVNFFMGPPPGSSDDPELADYWRSVGQLMQAESGYHHEQGTKPQTIGLALHDNPVGWASWVVEKFWRWGDTQGDIESRFDKDHLITNLMTYLVTDNIISSFWMYYASNHEARHPGPVTVPCGLAHFPGEFYPMPSRRLAEQAYNVKRWSKMEAGGHFAAMEEPVAFAADVIAFFDEYGR